MENESPLVTNRSLNLLDKWLYYTLHYCTEELAQPIWNWLSTAINYIVGIHSSAENILCLTLHSARYISKEDIFLIIALLYICLNGSVDILVTVFKYILLQITWRWPLIRAETFSVESAQ
jgi:hypothetical protein